MATWLLVLVLVFAVFSTQRSVRRSRSEAERFFTMRISAFTWLIGFIFVFALVFLPNRQRLLVIIPMFFIAVGVGKLWRNGRARVQREQRERDALERMKRVN